MHRCGRRMARAGLLGGRQENTALRRDPPAKGSPSLDLARVRRLCLALRANCSPATRPLIRRLHGQVARCRTAKKIRYPSDIATSVSPGDDLGESRPRGHGSFPPVHGTGNEVQGLGGHPRPHERPPSRRQSTCAPEATSSWRLLPTRAPNAAMHNQQATGQHRCKTRNDSISSKPLTCASGRLFNPMHAPA